MTKGWVTFVSYPLWVNENVAFIPPDAFNQMLQQNFIHLRIFIGKLRPYSPSSEAKYTRNKWYLLKKQQNFIHLRIFIGKLRPYSPSSEAKYTRNKWYLLKNNRAVCSHNWALTLALEGGGGKYAHPSGFSRLAEKRRRAAPSFFSTCSQLN